MSKGGLVIAGDLGGDEYITPDEFAEIHGHAPSEGEELVIRVHTAENW